jgi:hypothetical protein
MRSWSGVNFVAMVAYSFQEWLIRFELKLRIFPEKSGLLALNYHEC